MKKVLGFSIGVMVLASTAIVAINFMQPLNSIARAGNVEVYKHYNAIAETSDQHGCVEFWVSCSDYSYTLTQPTSGTIIEGGNITDNPSFDWDAMDVLDGRYIPSTSKQEEWGMKPVLDLGNNRVTYGLFPQSRVSDESLLATLEALPSSSIHESTGYYFYNGNFYQNCIGYKCDNDNHFADGTKVVDGTKYWFKCEPISWVIMSNSGSNYQVYSQKALHGGVAWGYSTSSVYGTSQVRDWLNGTDFLQAALFPEKNYLQSMTLTLDDGSATLNDKVRLLTKDEANDTTYFANNNARMIEVTDWAAAHRVCFKNGSSSYTRWWLCEANTDNTSNAWGVGLSGDVGNGGPKTGTASGDRAERPCITVSIA